MSEANERDFAQSEKLFRKELVSIALPVAMQSLMLALVGASDALMLGRLSQNAVSAVSLANLISFIMNLFIGSVVGGCSILIAQYYGKKDFSAIKKLMSMGLKLSGALSLIFFAGAFFAPRALMTVYTSEPELIDIGAEYLRIVSWSYLFAGLSQIYLTVMKISERATVSAVISVLTAVIDMVVYLFAYSLNTIITCGVFPAGGDTIYDAKSVLFSKWCFALPLALLGTFIFHWPVMLVYVIVMSDEIVKVPWIYPRYKKRLWKRNITREET